VWRIQVNDEPASWLDGLTAEDLDFAVAALDVLAVAGPLTSTYLAGHGLDAERIYTVSYLTSRDANVIQVVSAQLVKSRLTSEAPGRCLFEYVCLDDAAAPRDAFLVQATVQILPAAHRDRYRHEILAELSDLPPAKRPGYAVRLFLRSWQLRRALTSKGPDLTAPAPERRVHW